MSNEQGPVAMAVKRMTNLCNDWAEWEGENPEAIVDANAYVQSIDTAFAALESALREAPCPTCRIRYGQPPPEWVCPTCKPARAALALAEGVCS